MDLCRTKRLWTSLGKLLSAESVTITVVVETRIPSSFSLWECQDDYLIARKKEILEELSIIDRELSKAPKGYLIISVIKNLLLLPFLLLLIEVKQNV